MGGNQATSVNPFFVNNTPVDIHITTHGSDWYWAVTSVMAVTFLSVVGFGFRRPTTHRFFHYILGAVALVATIESFTLASNLGWTPIDVEWQRGGDVAGVNRQIWYVWYIAWFITWPLITLALLSTAAMPTPQIIYAAFLAATMSIMALIGALVHSTYKWGYFTFWLVAYFSLLEHTLFTSRRRAVALGADVQRAFLLPTTWVAFLWLLYPICWGVSEGGNVIAPDSEFVFYGVLDVLLIPVTCAGLLFGHRNIEPDRLGLYLRDYNDPVPGRGVGGVHGEKVGATNGVTNGAGTVEGQTATATPADTTSTAV